MELRTQVVYMYTIYGIHAYLGRGATSARAFDLKGHKHCIPSECPLEAIQVHIIADGLTKKQAALIEAEMIRDQGLENVWNNINGLTPEKARKLAQEILNRPIAKDGFMTVPKKLAKQIINNIKVKGDILIAADKNAQLHESIEELTEKVVVFDSDVGSRSLHGEKTGDVYLVQGDFLETNHLEKYDLILMNPPWTNLGNKFINKAISLLRPGGRLVCITSYEGWTQGRTGNTVKGSFKDLHNKGYFSRIEVIKASSDRDVFLNGNNWVWFIWENSKKNKKTTIVNRLGVTFKYQLKGNESYVPQIPNEESLFDWDSKILCHSVKKGGSRPENCVSIEIKKTGIVINNVPSGEISNSLTCFIPNGDIDKIKKIITPDWGVLFNEKMGSLRFPNLKESIWCID